MSTRSASSVAPALILVSHGSSVEPHCYEPVIELAQRLGLDASFRAVAVGFHKQSPSLEEAWQKVGDGPVIVVPFLASAGFFAARFMPGRMGLEPESFGVVQTVEGRPTVYTEPVGTHPHMHSIAYAVAQALVDDESALDAATTTLLVVGHGTPRHRESGASVHRCVAELSARSAWPTVTAAFVDEAPFIDAIADDLPEGHVLVLPYFVANGPHVSGDIPEGLGVEADDLWANPHVVGGHRFWFAPAVGTHPSMIDIVGARVDEAHQLLNSYFSDRRPRHG